MGRRKKRPVIRAAHLLKRVNLVIARLLLIGSIMENGEKEGEAHSMSVPTC